MIKIDRDTLCDFCKDNYEMPDSWHCEGCKCEEIREIYLDDKGIVDSSPENKIFSELKIGDKAYKINTKSILPSIKVCDITSLSKMNGDPLKLYYENISLIIDDTEANQQGFLFLIKKDCEQELEKICISRIIELSKIIGSLK